jgi:hypothetical protein
MFSLASPLPPFNVLSIGRIMAIENATLPDWSYI